MTISTDKPNQDELPVHGEVTLDPVPADHPRLQQAASAYWDLLHATVAAGQPPGTGEAEILRRYAATWGTVYGIARLATLGQIPRSVPGDQRLLLHQAVSTLYDGWQTDTRSR